MFSVKVYRFLDLLYTGFFLSFIFVIFFFFFLFSNGVFFIDLVDAETQGVLRNAVQTVS